MGARFRYQESIVQDAMVTICDRFDPFYVARDGVSAADVREYLEGQGYPPFAALEAASRYTVANERWA